MTTKDYCKAILKELDECGLVAYGSPVMEHGENKGEYRIKAIGHYSVLISYKGWEDVYRVGRVNSFTLSFKDVIRTGHSDSIRYDARLIYNKIMGYWN